ncbi:hypothetical protein PUNSTDRAFT_106906 [Punctularia strigosozonata HHB-11173 SS5]|uniref:uncharacterized protein n=1 Tax=Punctularia strigosozonata (strain HHB-11173) TaxID=741275 RepID=UPI0004417A02|nr:uncharacterized protein PUNSTDRAFT_106906 [Punctularia strigosozonata HHB-11173 SS5]EIN05861.1 hypothetical protein PUNSTDRAFT_106906 [Punctularia strigosozonata HHB-11173 SS5]
MDYPIPVSIIGPAESAIERLRRFSAGKSTTPQAGHDSALLASIRSALAGSDRLPSTLDDSSAHSVVTTYTDELPGEEELSWDDYTLVHSVGGIIKRQWNFKDENERIHWACLGYLHQNFESGGSPGQKSQHAPSAWASAEAFGRPIFGPFHRQDPDHDQRKAAANTVARSRAVFVFMRNNAHIYLLNGLTYSLSLPFIVRRAWAAFPYGVIIQRHLPQTEIDDADRSGEEPLPTIFSLTNPFAELSAVGLTEGIKGDGFSGASLIDEDKQCSSPLRSISPHDVVLAVFHMFGLDAADEIMITIDVEKKILTIWRYAYVKPKDTPTPLRPKRSKKSGSKPEYPDEGQPVEDDDTVRSRSGMPQRAHMPSLPPLRSEMAPSLSTGITMEALMAMAENDKQKDSEPIVQASFWVQKLYETDVTEHDARSWYRIQVTIFDSRWDGSFESSLIAICLPATEDLRTFSLVRQEDKSFLVSPFRNFKARAAVSVKATRPSCRDLLILKPSGATALITHGHQELPVVFRDGDLPSNERTSMMIDDAGVKHGPISAFENPALTTVTLALESGKRMRACLDLLPTSRLVNMVLLSMSTALPHDDFYALHSHFLRLWSSQSFSPASDAQWDCMRKSLYNVLGFDSSPSLVDPNNNPWLRLHSSGSHRRHIGDPVLRKLRLPPALEEQCERPTDVVNLALVRPALLALHLLGETLRLFISWHHQLLRLVPLICRLAQLVRPEWADYWKRLLPSAVSEWPDPYAPASHASNSTPATALPVWPTDETTSLLNRLNGVRTGADLSDRVNLVSTLLGDSPSGALGRVDVFRPLRHLAAVFAALADRSVPDVGKRTQHAMQVLMRHGTGAETLDGLPLGLVAPLREAARTCQFSPPANWPAEGYKLIGRNDLAEGTSAPPELLFNDGYRSIKDHLNSASRRPTTEEITARANAAGPSENSGPTGTELDLEDFTKIRFGQDQRMAEVARMLSSSLIPGIKLVERPDASEHEVAKEQQHQVLRVAERTLALPYGRAMFTFGSMGALRRETYAIPKMEFAIRLLPQNVVLHLDQTTKLPAECTQWGEFHNGVAAGLRIAPSATAVSSSWIAFNKPSELTPEHAGFLYALGLNGHLRDLLTWHTFHYLTPKHDLTSIAILLGLSAAHVGSGDEHVTKLLAIHTPALLPTPNVDLNVSLMTQTAGLAGIGLLYMGTKNRRMAEVCLAQLTRRDLIQPDLTNEHREAYTLSAALAFGMIMLGKGAAIPADTRLLERLQVLVHGENLVTKDGTPRKPTFDLNLSSPAATIAVGLMFLRTGRRDVAHLLAIPDTTVELNAIQPSFLMVRAIARALIMWDEITPSKEWVNEQIPVKITNALDVKMKGIAVDDSLELAYYNILAGCAFAIGLKYAGTAREEAYLLVIGYYDLYSRLAYTTGTAFDSRIKRATIREGLNTISIALCMIMAGTGEINCLRRLRYAYGMYNQPIRYGTYLATHLSLGLLFLGGGRFTLGTSDAAVAAMVTAFYPRWAHSSSDNKSYLQALRHLWVLAVEPRCLIARDVDTKEVVYLPIKIKVKDDPSSPGGPTGTTQLIAPTLIPDLDRLLSIRVDTPRYWPFYLDLARYPRHRDALLRGQTLLVKRRTAFLSYVEDPKGARSLFVRSGAGTGEAAVLDVPQAGDERLHPAGDIGRFIGSFSNDVVFLAFADHLCRGPSGDGKEETEAEKLFRTYAHASLVDAVVGDKPQALQALLTLYQHRTMDPAERFFMLRLHDLCFAHEFYRGQYERRAAAEGGAAMTRPPLLRPSTVAGAVQALDARLEQSTRDDVRFKKALACYARGAPPPEGGEDSETQRKLAWYLVRRAVPPAPVLAHLKLLAAQAYTQCAGRPPPEGTADASALEVGIRQVARMAGTSAMGSGSTAGRGWTPASVDEIFDLWKEGA